MDEDDNSSDCELAKNVVKEQNENGNLDGFFNEFGQNKEKWIDVLRIHFSVTHVTQLQYLTKNEIKKIQSYAEHDWEKQALNTLFNRESAPEQIRELKQIINTLKDDKAMYDAKQSSENAQKLITLQHKIGINEIDFKIPRNEDDLKAFVNSVSLHFDELQQTVDRTQLSNHQVIGNASGGLALSGIYIDHLQNKYRKCRTVLELHAEESVCLKQSNMTQIDKTETFNTYEKYDAYIRHVETFGVTFSGKLKASSLVEAGGYFNRQNDENEQRNTQTTYYCRERSCTVPVKSFEMTLDTVSLTPQAISRLKDIEDLVLLESSKHFIQAECLRFFKEFGVVVNMGTLEFGGIYKWKAIFESEFKSDEKKTNEALTTILTGYINAGLSFGTKSLGIAASVGYTFEDRKSKINHNQCDNLHTTVQISKVGGPTEVENFHMWRYGLLSYNNTWSLIDRGDLVGIWDVVNTHTTDFVNSIVLSSILREAWANKTNIPNKDFSHEKNLQQQLKNILQEMDEWSRELTPNIAKCYPILQKFNAVKLQRNEILELKRDTLVISNETIKTFFLKILQRKDRFDATTVAQVKHIIRQIVHPFAIEALSGCTLFALWMLPDEKPDHHLRISDNIEDLQSFLSITENIFVPYIESYNIQKSSDDYVTIEFQKICRRCLINLRNGEKYLDVLLMTAILIPFGFDIIKHYFSTRLYVTSVKQVLEDMKRWLPMQETTSEKSNIDTEILIANLFIRNLTQRENMDEDEKSLFEIYFLPISKSLRYTKEIKEALLSRIEDKSEFRLKGFQNYLEQLQTPRNEFISVNISSQVTNLKDRPIINITEQVTTCHDSDSSLSLLHQLGLDKYYPDKIQLHDVVTLKPPNNYVFKDIPWIFLKGVISCRIRSRYELIAQLLEDLNALDSEIDEDPWNSDNFTDSRKKVCLNPLDLTVLVYQCCSPILKQLFAEKMLLCKLAFPLVVNHTDRLVVNLWPMRQCIVEERTKEIHREMSAADMESPIVSVIRLGEISMSKSIIINKLIFRKGHDAFHHKNCSLGTSLRVLSNGTIESAWCLSSDRNIHYLNLRGDANEHTKQVSLLLKISSVIVVMLPIECLNKQCTQSILINRKKTSPDCRIVLAFDGHNVSKRKAVEICGQSRKTHNFDQKDTLMCCLALQDDKINLDIMCKDLSASISKLLIKNSNSTTKKEHNESLSNKLERCDLAGVYVDEQFDMYKKYRHKAEELISLIPQQSSNVKEIVIPLQGKLLQSLANARKTAKKSSVKLGNKNIDDLLNTATTERKNQAIQYTNQALPFIKTFLSTIISLYLSGEHYLIFVRYLKLLLDCRSREVIPGKRERYKHMWGNIQQAQKTNTVTEPMKELVKACEIDLAEASFGLEHLFREFGQIFEAMSCQKTLLTQDALYDIERIPEVAANLVLQGESFELMNGDVGDVPLIWIESVFYHLKCIINDKKVLILSVLGIQSSGKSTLLNTMFGLQFSVSAGRCTRGLYMQLLKVDNHEDFDYLLVIDTEGIRAPELKDKRYDHDNELATYVIGIGDVILINIKGENTVELTDILGIVVQALMRLKNVNKTSHLKKRCIFVHQNVAASDASVKMLQQRQNLVDELNERTKEAAEQENVQDVHQFSDILHFDLDNDVMYFPDLWEGSPPMASINPDYSEQAGKVKDSVLYRHIPDRITYYTISETVTRMRDLWDGLLADDFVFSFRNNLELKAYMRIQSKFQEISFELETYINEIICNECSTDLQYELEASDIDNVEKLLSTIETKMGRKANAKFWELQEKLENFFEKDEKKDIVIQWKQNKTIQLEELYNRLIPNAKKRLKLLAKETKFQLSQDQQLASFKKKANEMARKLACEFSGRCPEESIIQQRFSLAWNDIVAHFSTDETEDTVVSINSDIDGILSEKFRDRINQIDYFQKLIVSHPYGYRMQRLSGSLELQNIDHKKHLEICRSWKQAVSSIVKWNDKNEGGIHSMRIQALAITDSIFETIDGEIERFSSTANTKFDTTFVIKLLYIIRNDINEHNTQKVYPFKFTKSYESFLLTHTSSYLKRKLSDLNLRYNKKYSLKSKVERHKNKARTIFDMLVQSASMDSIALYCFEEVLSSAIIEHIMKQIPNRVAEVMLRKYHHSKYELIKDILISLANKQDSEDYFRYIHHPQAFAKSYLKTRTSEYFFHKSNETTKNRYFQFSEDQANIDFQTLSEVLYDLAHCTESLTIPQFTEMLRRNLKAKIGITILSSSFSQVESNLQNSQTFIELIDVKRMESMKESVLAKFQVTSDDNVEWKQNPYDTMMDILWGCDAKCPFCYEPCMNAQKDHLKDTPHKCAVHRVKGVTGRYIDQTTDLAKTFCNISVCDSVDKFKHDNKSVCYKEYKTIYPEWDIAPNPETSKYWKWFCCEYKQSIEDKYTMQIEISDHWKTLSKVDAINSISLTSS